MTNFIIWLTLFTSPLKTPTWSGRSPVLDRSLFSSSYQTPTSTLYRTVFRQTTFATTSSSPLEILRFTNYKRRAVAGRRRHKQKRFIIEEVNQTENSRLGLPIDLSLCLHVYFCSLRHFCSAASLFICDVQYNSPHILLYSFNCCCCVSLRDNETSANYSDINSINSPHKGTERWAIPHQSARLCVAAAKMVAHCFTLYRLTYPVHHQPSTRLHSPKPSSHSLSVSLGILAGSLSSVQYPPYQPIQRGTSINIACSLIPHALSFAISINLGCGFI